MQHRMHTRLAAAGAAVLTSLSLATGAAAADGVARPDDRAAHGTGAIAQTNAWVTAGGVARPDDRATHGPGAIESAQRDIVLRPDDRADRRLPNDAPLTQPTAGEGFHWADAGIGSAATLGVVLLVAGAAVIRLRQGVQTA